MSLIVLYNGQLSLTRVYLIYSKEITHYFLNKCKMKHIFKQSGKTFLKQEAVLLHYVNVSVLIKFSQKTSVFTLIIISSP